MSVVTLPERDTHVAEPPAIPRALRDGARRWMFWSALEERVRSAAFGGREAGRRPRGGGAVGTDSLVVVLDVNDTLVCREARARIRARRPHDAVVGGRRLWYRPHVHTFLAYALRRHRVGVFTSMMWHNLAPVLERLVARPLVQLSCRLSRDHTEADRAPNRARHATLKPIEAVYRHVEQASASNVLMVDNDVRKLRRSPHNAVAIASYDKAVLERDDHAGDDDLLWLALYLEYCEWARAQFGSVQLAARALSLEEFVHQGRERPEAQALVLDLAQLQDEEPQLDTSEEEATPSSASRD